MKRALLCALAATACAEVRIGSKAFTESVILGEMATLLARDAGVRAEHRRQLGGTRILWSALLRGDLDAYPEYTGTLARELFAGRDLAGEEALRAEVARHGIRMTRPLGFDNTYAIAMKEETAERLGIRTISDLARHPGLRLGFSSEFLSRADGWPALRSRYGLPHRNVRGLDHDLAYRAVASGALDATDVYTTDAEIRHHGLRLLADDRRHFPAYEAVLLYRADLERRHPAVIAAFRRLEGRIATANMRELNARVKLGGAAEAAVAEEFLRTHLGLDAAAAQETVLSRLGRATAEHLFLVAVSLLAAIAVAVPLGIAAARRPRLGHAILAVAGVIQTVPSLALLVFLLPLLGIGAPPALAALFLYGLLPIVRNTHAGLADIPAPLRESAEALGLPPGARLRLVELPMASRAILAGIQTSAVINVGTATLGALVGAGGYGQAILTGIRLDDVALILEGALPAAALAIGVQLVFAAAERWIVPRGLRLAAPGPAKPGRRG